MVREVGGREVEKVSRSVEAMERLADEIERIAPEALVVMSPHSRLSAGGFVVKTAPSLSGTFRSFGAPSVGIKTEPDLELARALVESASEQDVRLIPDDSDPELDHGILVPLYFLARREYPLVCLSLSLHDYRDHYRIGMAVRDTVSRLSRRTVFIASGDMSHRLKPGAPAGYSPRGSDFDQQMVDVIESADFRRLFELDPMVVEEAGECGLRSVFALAGTVDGHSVKSEVLSYEGPFGVGYLVARVEPLEADPKRRLVSM
jgi:AmmeMemoRadiSam system protein B